MAYNIKEIVDSVGGIDYIKELIEEQAYTKNMIAEIIGVPKGSSVTIKKFLDYCGCTIKYPRLSRDKRLWLMQSEKYNGEYWKSKYILNILHERLRNPIVNITGTTSRYVVACNKHPRSSKSNQVKAHIILWELINKRFLPEGYELEPIDGNFQTLLINNFKLRSILERKINYSKGKNNSQYKHGLSKSGLKRGNWEKVSIDYRNINNFCSVCNTKKDLIVHHIINYHLFKGDYKLANSHTNLLTLCSSCHAKLHQGNVILTPLILGTRYETLLELLESLKSQVPDTLMETYNDVEKQLGLTGNQQPSP